MSIRPAEGSNVRRFERPAHLASRARATGAVPAGGAIVVGFQDFVRAREARAPAVDAGDDRLLVVDAGSRAAPHAGTGAVATLGAAIRGDRRTAATAQAVLLAGTVVGELVG